MLSEIRS